MSMTPSPVPHRAPISVDEVVDLIRELYGLIVTTIKELSSYDDKNFLVNVENTSGNKNIQQICPHGYVLKLLNSRDSALTNHVDAEHEMMMMLNREGFCCPRPVPNKLGYLTSKESPPWTRHTIKHTDDEKQGYYTCRLLTYIPGEMLYSVPYTESLMYEAGIYVARMQQVFKDYHAQSLEDIDIIWRLENVPRLRQYIHAVRDSNNRSLALNVIHVFEGEVMPLYDSLCKGTIHGDFNDHNIIVNELKNHYADSSKLTQDFCSTMDSNEGYSISGVIDFGDASYSYYVFDLAVTMMYLSLENTSMETLHVGGHVVRGYQTIRKLTPAERSVLKYCVAARYTQSVVMGEFSHSQEPDNDYLLVTVDKGWPQLHNLWNTATSELNQIWGLD